jgi:thiamine-phosphate pyrophosphorylase
MLKLPLLYAILDTSRLPDDLDLISYARALAAAGVALMQYRNKSGHAGEMLEDARTLREALPGTTLIMNDRADLCIAAGLNGVHLGQDDLPVPAARKLASPPLLVGISTHNMEQVEWAEQTDADYIAIGPVFSTQSKAKPDPSVGIEGVRQARQLTKRPLVAIGGITLENCRGVIDAGADAVAVISALTREPRKSAEAFLRVLG